MFETHTNFFLCAYAQIFFPLLQDEHWYAAVADLDKQKHFVLNSMGQRKVTATTEFVLEVVRSIILLYMRQLCDGVHSEQVWVYYKLLWMQYVKLYLFSFCKVFNVEQVLDKNNGYNRINGMALWDVVHVSVPQQVNK